MCDLVGKWTPILHMVCVRKILFIHGKSEIEEESVGEMRPGISLVRVSAAKTMDSVLLSGAEIHMG